MQENHKIMDMIDQETEGREDLRDFLHDLIDHEYQTSQYKKYYKKKIEEMLGKEAGK